MGENFMALTTSQQGLFWTHTSTMRRAGDCPCACRPWRRFWQPPCGPGSGPP